MGVYTFLLLTDDNYDGGHVEERSNGCIKQCNQVLRLKPPIVGIGLAHHATMQHLVEMPLPTNCTHWNDDVVMVKSASEDSRDDLSMQRTHLQVLPVCEDVHLKVTIKRDCHDHP